MTERVAEGEVHIGLNDSEVKAGLERVERQFDAAMRDISHQEAAAKITADLAPLDDKLAQAKRKVRELEGAKATVRADADTTALDAKIKNAQRAVKRLDGKKANLEIKLKGVEKAIAAERAIDQANAKRVKASEERELRAEKVVSAAKAAAARSEKARMAEINARAKQNLALRKQQASEEAKAAAAELRSEKERMATINANARQSLALRKQQASEEAKAARTERDVMRAHSEALAIDRKREEIARRRPLQLAEEQIRVINLQRQYAKLTDRAEFLAKQRRFTAEGHAKLQLDTRSVFLELERVKAELNFLGGHPPAQIKVDIDRKGLVNKTKGFFHDTFAKVIDKAANIGDVTTRIGPFTGSIKQFAVALSFLGPTITEILGSAGALIGVLGAGIAGAAAVGAGGLTGLGSSFLGLKFATRNTGQEIAQARKSINALQAATLKYGASSDKTKAKQDELNSVLKQISPLARETALGIERFYSLWDKRTAATQRSLGNIARNGFRALQHATPLWARETNKLSDALDKSLRGGFKFLRGHEFSGNFKTILDNFNAAVPTLLHAAGSLGRAFLNMGREGSKAFGPLSRSIDNIAGKFLSFTQKDTFGDTVARWVKEAGDISKFFGAATRVVVHFFGAGSTAGDNLVNTMTNALNRWDRFIQSVGGQNKLHQFFDRSVTGFETLYKAVAPLIQLFALWSAGLEPAVQMITKVFSWVTQLVNVLGHLVGLHSAVATFGATLGAMWAVGKIGAFVSTFARIPGILKEIKASQGVLGVFKSLANGDFLKSLKGGGGVGASMEAAGTAAAAEIGGAMEAAGTAVAAEIAAAMSEGGLVSAAERAAAGAAGGAAAGAAGGAAAGAAGGAAAAEATAAAGTAVTAATTAAEAAAGVGAASVATAAGVGLLTTALGALAVKLIVSESNGDKWRDGLVKMAATSAQNTTAADKMLNSYGDVSSAIKNAHKEVTAADKALNATKPGTKAHAVALDRLKNAQNYETQAVKHWHDEVKNQVALRDTAIKQDKQELTSLDSRNKKRTAQLKLELANTKDSKTRAQIEFVIGKQEAARQAILDRLNADQNRAAASGAQMARVYAGLKPVAGQAEQALGKLARVAGKKLSISVGTKFTGAGDVNKVASAASKAVGSGVKASVALKIVADSKNAEAAVKRLNSIKLTTKKLQIVEQGGEAAIKVVEALIGHKLSPKHQDIIERGGAPALALLRQIIGTKLPNKSFDIVAQDQASSTISNVLNWLSRIPKTVRTQIVASHAGPFATHATGGVGNASVARPTAATARRQDKAIDRLAAGNIAKSGNSSMVQGTKINAPRAIYGEEPGKPEFVISTNRAYRARNVGLLAQAAKSLGVTMAAMGTFSGKPTGVAQTGGGNEFHPSAKLPRKPKKLKKKQHKPFTTKRGWAGYIANLHTQQDYWEREVSIRDSQVQEPADMVIVTGQKVVTDPNTGEQTKIDQYGPNPEIEKTYKPQLAAVLDAMTQLLQIIQALVQGIPVAEQAAQQEINYHSQAIGDSKHPSSLKGQLEAEKNRWDKESGSYRKDSDHQKTHNDRVSKLKKKIDDNEQAIKTLKDDKKTLAADRVEAGFDWREQMISYTTTKGEYDSASGNAQTSADQQNADATAGASGGGGSGGTTLSYGDQAALADTEKLNIIKEFAGNMQTGAAYAAQMNQVIGGASASGGSQVNPVTAGPIATGRVAAGAVAAGSAVSGMASAGAAMASGVTATRALDTGRTSAAAPTSATATPAQNVTYQTIEVKPTFANVPPDPMPFARGVAFEIAGAL